MNVSIRFSAIIVVAWGVCMLLTSSGTKSILGRTSLILKDEKKKRCFALDISDLLFRSKIYNKFDCIRLLVDQKSSPSVDRP